MIQHRLARAIVRTWPFPRGTGRIIDKCFSRLQVPEQRAVVRTTDGFDMVVNPSELIGRHLYLSGEFDRSIVELLLAFAMPGDTLLDIGANVGYVSGCFLKNISDARVVAVEPQPMVFKMLSENLAPFGRASLYPFAIASSDGIGYFETRADNLGAGHLVENATASSSHVETRCADSLFRDMDLSSLDLVKIDAEGAEETILCSCKPHFQRIHPRCVLFEDNGADMSPSGKIRRLFSDLGYAVFAIRKSITRISLQAVGVAPVAHDYLAISMTRPIPENARRRYKIPSNLRDA